MRPSAAEQLLPLVYEGAGDVELNDQPETPATAP